MSHSLRCRLFCLYDYLGTHSGYLIRFVLRDSSGDVLNKMMMFFETGTLTPDLRDTLSGMHDTLPSRLVASTSVTDSWGYSADLLFVKGELHNFDYSVNFSSLHDTVCRVVSRILLSGRGGGLTVSTDSLDDFLFSSGDFANTPTVRNHSGASSSVLDIEFSLFYELLLDIYSSFVSGVLRVRDVLECVDALPSCFNSDFVISFATLVRDFIRSFFAGKNHTWADEEFYLLLESTVTSAGYNAWGHRNWKKVIADLGESDVVNGYIKNNKNTYKLNKTSVQRWLKYAYDKNIISTYFDFFEHKMFFKTE